MYDSEADILLQLSKPNQTNLALPYHTATEYAEHPARRHLTSSPSFSDAPTLLETSMDSVAKAKLRSSHSPLQQLPRIDGSQDDDTEEEDKQEVQEDQSGKRKRPRRRYDEINRLYSCNWPGCDKVHT